MILLNDFIEGVIKQIQNAIEEFSAENHYKAQMPEKIDFEIYTIFKNGESYVLSIEDQNYNNLTKLNLTIFTAHYPWLKGKK